MNDRFPSGLVTFLTTDIVNSSVIQNDLGYQRYQEEFHKPHDRRVLEIVEKNTGHKFKGVGDGFFVAFKNTKDAINCANELQNSLRTNPIRSKDNVVSIRVAIHLGEIQIEPDEDGDYYSPDVNYVARIVSITNGNQILVSENTYQSAPNQKNYSWKPWHNRRLKSFEEEPQTVYELLWDESSRGEPGAAWLPEWFKGDLSRYIARPEKETEVIRGYISKGEENKYRLVSITGLGGFGKTRLAIRCAVDMAGVFEGRVKFVQLAQYKGSSEEGEKNLAGELALILKSEKADPDAVLQALSNRDEKTLYLLDSFETVAGQATSQWVEKALMGTRNLHFLVATQIPVELINAERLIDLNDGMTQDESFQLFKHRAENHKGRWEPKQEEEERIRRIVTRLEYIPLAVELAAGWFKLKTLVEIEKDLTEKLLGTVTTQLRAPIKPHSPDERHRSLRICLDWSYELLTEPQQQAFRCLGVFGGLFTAESAKAIVPMDNIEQLLYELIETSLLKRTENDECSRFGLHNITREYALEKLHNVPEWQDISARYLQTYSQFVSENCSEIGIENRTKRELIALEWSNLMRAIPLGIETNNTEFTPPIAAGLWHYIYREARFREGETLYTSILHWYENLPDPEWQWLRSFSNSLGLIYWRVGRYDDASILLQRALQFDETNHGENHRDTATSLHSLALVYDEQARYLEAKQLFERALSIRTTLLGEREVDTAISYHDLGMLFETLGVLDQAETLLTKALAIREVKLGDENPFTLLTLLMLARIYRIRRKFDKAESLLHRALKISETIYNDYHPGVADVLHEFGTLYWVQGKYNEAEPLYLRALSIYSKSFSENNKATAACLNGVASLYTKQKRFAEAEKSFLKVNRIYATLYGTNHPNYSYMLRNFALCYEAQEKYDEAEPLLVQALEIYNAVKELEHESKDTWNRLKHVRELKKGKKRKH